MCHKCVYVRCLLSVARVLPQVLRRIVALYACVEVLISVVDRSAIRRVSGHGEGEARIGA